MVPISKTRVCARTGCFAYNTKFRNNCCALTEALDPCNFYKSKQQHEQERLRELKLYSGGVYGQSL